MQYFSLSSMFEKECEKLDYTVRGILEVRILIWMYTS